MGQYYSPTIIKNHKVKSKMDIEATFCPFDYNDNGLKLMEHSYIGNEAVNAVRNWLIDNGGGRLVWAGDYADEEPGAPKETNISLIAGDLTPTIYNDEDRPEYRYYINHDKKEFVDIDNCEGYEKWAVDRNGHKHLLYKQNPIDPLPLLTAEGNGRGGGDYRGTNLELVGSWARDFITIATAPPEGFKRINTGFLE